MPDPDSSNDFASRLWRSLRLLITGHDHEPSLRESLEEAIDEHDDVGAGRDDLSAVERAMLKNMLHFGERQAGDIGVPRSDMVVFDLEDGFPALVALFKEAGHSRMPVFRGNRDNIIGMAHIKDIYAHIADTFDDAVSSAAFADFPVEPLLRPVLYVPASMRIIDLLARMRAGKTHMAIIVDEYGGTDGLVTIEDLVEEIVGDIEDEHDDAPEDMLVACGDGIWDADARIELEDLGARLDPRLAAVDDDVDTLGGLAIVLVGHVPQTGEVIAHPSGWTIEIIEADSRRVGRTRLTQPATPDSSAIGAG